jgi:predicted DNA binding protein
MMGFERPDYIIFFFSVLGDRNFCTENGSYYIYKRVDFVGSRNCCWLRITDSDLKVLIVLSKDQNHEAMMIMYSDITWKHELFSNEKKIASYRFHVMRNSKVIKLSLQMSDWFGI